MVHDKRKQLRKKKRFKTTNAFRDALKHSQKSEDASKFYSDRLDEMAKVYTSVHGF